MTIMRYRLAYQPGTVDLCDEHAESYRKASLGAVEAAGYGRSEGTVVKFHYCDECDRPEPEAYVWLYVDPVEVDEEKMAAMYADLQAWLDENSSAHITWDVRAPRPGSGEAEGVYDDYDRRNKCHGKMQLLGYSLDVPEHVADMMNRALESLY